ncbi:MAG: hypothetical protein IT332_11245 [Ardenticatenales bacterium]|nr:hypothetical protein [Ardenticatenales bacterium]
MRTVSRLRRITVLFLFAVLLLLGPAVRESQAAVEGSLRSAADDGRVYLPLVGHYARNDLVPPVEAGAPTARTPRPTATPPPPVPGAWEWSNFTLSRHVTSLYMDAAGQRMWVGTTSGLVTWDMRSATPQKFTVAEGLLTNEITAVHVDPLGRVWVGHDLGVSLSEDGGRRWQALRDAEMLYGLEVSAIVADGAGGTWFGTRSGLVERAADGTFDVVHTPAVLIDQPITSALRDAAGNLWFGADGAGLVRRAPDGGWRVFSLADGLPDAHVLSLAADSGGIWVGTENGLGRRDAAGGWSVVRQAHSEEGRGPIGRVVAVAAAPGGDVWIAAENNLLRLPRGQSEAVYRSDDDVFGATAVAATADGEVWVGAETTLAHRAADGTWSERLTPDVVPDARVKAIALGEDGAWFGTAGGVAHRDGDGAWRGLTATADDAQTFFYDMDVASDGRVWLATGFGLIEIAPSGEQRLHHIEARLPFSYVASVALDPDDRPWIASGPGPVTDANIAWLGADGVWRSRLVTHPLTGTPIWDFMAIEVDAAGTVWLGSTGGLFRLDRNGRTTGHYGAFDDLPSNLVTSIAADAKGRVWVGTTGLFNEMTGRYDGGGVAMLDHDIWTQYTADDGLLTNKWITGIDFDRDGGTWFATEAGLSHMDAAGRWSSAVAADGLPAGQAIDVAVAADGGVWASMVAPSDGDPNERPRLVAHRPPGGAWRTVSTTLGAAATPIQVGGIARNPAGGIVLGSPRHIIWQAADGARRSAFAGLHLLDVGAAATDALGNVWFGSPIGLARRARNGGWRMWTVTEGLPDGVIDALHVDVEGSVWLGLTQTEPADGSAPSGGGVARLGSDGAWEHWTRRDGLASNRVRDIALGPGGALWAATEPETDEFGDTLGGGVSRRAGDGTWTTFTAGDGLLDDWTSSIVAAADGEVFVGGQGGISRRSPGGEWSTLGAEDGLPDSGIETLEIGPGGDLWIGTSDGAARRRSDGALEVWGLADGLGDVNIVSIGVGDDAVWFGHLFHGLSRMSRR